MRITLWTKDMLYRWKFCLILFIEPLCVLCLFPGWTEWQPCQSKALSGQTSQRTALSPRGAQ